jgi:hypothetical protein
MPTSAHHPRTWRTDNLYNSAQMSTQAVVRLSPEPASRFVYDFLAHSPPPRTRPVEPLPPTPTVRATVRRRRRSSTISAISSWTTPGSHVFVPVNSPAASRRPSLVRSLRSARRHSATFHSFSTPTHIHPHSADLHAPGYASAIIQLPTTPRTAAPRLPPSYFPSNRDNNCQTDMKFTLAAAPRPREGSISVHASSTFPSTPAKRKGLMRFLRPGTRPRSTIKPPTHRQVPRSARPSDPPASPTTDAFRIAHQKRAHYAKHGALPLPLEAEVELMQFVDGGSRSDAISRLGAAAYTDAAGVVYSDETEAGECLPLLLAPEDNLDEHHSSTMEDVFAFASSPPPSPLAPRTPPVLPSATVPLATSTQALIFASSPRALQSVPARSSSADEDTGATAYLHLTFDAASVPPARGRARRRRPAQLTLPLTVPSCLRPTVVIGFDDSFLPCGAVRVAVGPCTLQLC